MSKILCNIRSRFTRTHLRADLPHPHFGHFLTSSKEVTHIVGLHVAALLVIQHGGTMLHALHPALSVAGHA